MAAQTLTVTGVVERAEVKLERPFRANRYAPGEQNDILLDVALRLEDNSAVYFKVNCGRRTIGAAPGMAIVVHMLKDDNWVKEVGERKVATPGVPNDNRIESLLKVGEKITVEGRLKADRVSRVGNAYKVLNYVRKV